MSKELLEIATESLLQTIAAFHNIDGGDMVENELSDIYYNALYELSVKIDGE